MRSPRIPPSLACRYVRHSPHLPHYFLDIARSSLVIDYHNNEPPAPKADPCDVGAVSSSFSLLHANMYSKATELGPTIFQHFFPKLGQYCDPPEIHIHARRAFHHPKKKTNVYGEYDSIGLWWINCYLTILVSQLSFRVIGNFFRNHASP